jgi:hypothetical protein
VVIFNAAPGSTRLKLDLPAGGVETFRQVWPEGTGRSYPVSQNQFEITLPGRTVAVLMS